MNILTIASRDLRSYLSSYTGYVILAAVLFIVGLLWTVSGLNEGPELSRVVLSEFFYWLGGGTIGAALLLTMRSLSEERSRGTDVLLRTSTIGDGQVVFGKYLAAMAMIGLFALLSLYMPALIFVKGKVSMAQIAVGYLGVLFMGSAVASIGIFGSSLFKSQLAAGVVSLVIFALMLGAWIIGQVSDPPFDEVFGYLALWDHHYQPFQKGRLLLTGGVYYASVTFVFLTLATKVLEGRRWE